MFLVLAPCDSDPVAAAPPACCAFPCVLAEANNGFIEHKKMQQAQDDAWFRAIFEACLAIRRHPAPCASSFGPGATVFDLSAYCTHSASRNPHVDPRLPYCPGCYLVSNQPDMNGERYVVTCSPLESVKFDTT